MNLPGHTRCHLSYGAESTSSKQRGSHFRRRVALSVFGRMVVSLQDLAHIAVSLMLRVCRNPRHHGYFVSRSSYARH
jgi:hypothetical protein